MIHIEQSGQSGSPGYEKVFSSRHEIAVDGSIQAVAVSTLAFSYPNHAQFQTEYRCSLTRYQQAAQSRFAEIAEAYEILSHDSSRHLYDHARRVRAAHEINSSERGGGHGNPERGAAFGGRQDPGTEWFFVDDMDGGGGMFGSSFGGGGSGGEAFGPTFGYGGFGGTEGGAGWGGAGDRRGVHEFVARDPMELFEVRSTVTAAVWYVYRNDQCRRCRSVFVAAPPSSHCCHGFLSYDVLVLCDYFR